MLFVVDFDGTLASIDSVDSLLSRFADPAWESIETAWLKNEITAVECMAQQLALVRASRKELETHFSAVPLDPGFPEFLRLVQPHAHVAIVSDGLDYGIRTALRDSQIAELPIYANSMLFTSHGLRLGFPHLDRACTAGNGVCKCAVSCRLAEEHGGPTVLIGDGKSDACLAHKADFVFSKGALTAYCEANGIPHRPFRSFSEIANALFEPGTRVSPLNLPASESF